MRCPVTGSRVLVVEDDPTLARALGINLRARGYQVDLTSGGAQALRAAAANHPDVVLLDLGLPDMDGVDVIAGLRGWSQSPSSCSRPASPHTTRWKHSTQVLMTT